MTKLMEWLTVLGGLFAIWATVVTNRVESSFYKQYPTLVLLSPLIFIGVFGVYAATVVLYRVFTFNNCEEAAAELQKEIQEARTELKRLGFKLKTNTK